MKRKLVDGRIVDETEESTLMTIDSKCYRKWLFVDLETSDVWRFDPEREIGKWRPASDNDLLAIVQVISKLQGH